MPYPFVPPTRPEVKDPAKMVRRQVTREESLFLDDLDAPPGKTTRAPRRAGDGHKGELCAG